MPLQHRWFVFRGGTLKSQNFYEKMYEKMKKISCNFTLSPLKSIIFDIVKRPKVSLSNSKY